MTSPSGVTEMCDILELEEGHYSIKFVPKEMGVHTVSVKHKGMHISGEWRRCNRSCCSPLSQRSVVTLALTPVIDFCFPSSVTDPVSLPSPPPPRSCSPLPS